MKVKMLWIILMVFWNQKVNFRFKRVKLIQTRNEEKESRRKYLSPNSLLMELTTHESFLHRFHLVLTRFFLSLSLSLTNFRFSDLGWRDEIDCIVFYVNFFFLSLILCLKLREIIERERRGNIERIEPKKIVANVIASDTFTSRRRRTEMFESLFCPLNTIVIIIFYVFPFLSSCLRMRKFSARKSEKEKKETEWERKKEGMREKERSRTQALLLVHSSFLFSVPQFLSFFLLLSLCPCSLSLFLPLSLSLSISLFLSLSFYLSLSLSVSLSISLFLIICLSSLLASFTSFPRHGIHSCVKINSGPLHWSHQRHVPLLCNGVHVNRRREWREKQMGEKRTNRGDGVKERRERKRNKEREEEKWNDDLE